MQTTILSRVRAVCVTTSLLSIVVALPLVAQDGKKDASSKAATSPSKDSSLSAADEAKIEQRAGRVPAYFGQIALAADQREKIREVQRGYYQKILRLEREIEALQNQRLKECEAILTKSQQDLLDNLRKAAKDRDGRKGASDSKKPEAPSNTKKA